MSSGSPYTAHRVSCNCKQFNCARGGPAQHLAYSPQWVSEHTSRANVLVVSCASCVRAACPAAAPCCGVVQPGELWGGVPARFIRELSDDEKEALKAEADDIRRLAWQQSAEQLPVGTAWRGVEEYRRSVVEAGQAVTVPMRRLKYDARKQTETDAANALSVNIGRSQEIK